MKLTEIHTAVVLGCSIQPAGNDSQNVIASNRKPKVAYTSKPLTQEEIIYVTKMSKGR